VTLTTSLLAHLQHKHALLLLDNCEHVLDAAAFVADLLAASPALKVLATSRAPLHIRAEHTWPVPTLSDAEAKQLFEERAGLTAADSTTADTIAAICRRLDLLPLAIELIAGRARALPPVELLRQLGQPLSALTAAPRDVPKRHQTLRAAIAWSYDRLGAEAQSTFRHLGVFASGATPAALQAVVGPAWPVLPRLEALHEVSLIQAYPGPDDTRFVLLETLREYALEQLAAQGEVVAARRRHAAYFLSQAEQAQPHLTAPEQTQWLERLEQEHTNLSAALDWLSAHAPESGLRLAVALEQFWEVRGYLGEGRRRLAEALEHCPEAAPPMRGAALAAASMLALRQGDYDSAQSLNEQSLDVWQRLHDRQATHRTLRRLGTVAYGRGDHALAAARYEESLAVAREIGDAAGMAGALNNLGLIATDEADYVRARRCYGECLPIFRALDDRLGIGLALTNLGLVVWYELDYAAAQALLEEGLATFKASGHKWGMALALLNLGNVARSQAQLGPAKAFYQESLALDRELGDQPSASYALFGLGDVAYALGAYATARGLYRQSLQLRREAGEKQALPRSLEGLAQLERLAGRANRAARLFGAAEAVRESQGWSIMPPYQAEYQHEIKALRAALGAAEFAAAWAAGRALTLEQAAALALQSDAADESASV
jgi:predicted ATPase